MIENQLREKIVNNIELRIKDGLDKYYEKYKNNIGYLLYYPLMNIEYEFINGKGSFAVGIIEKEQASWFLKEMIYRGLNIKNIFTFKENEFNYYRNVLSININNMYLDYNLCKEIKDDRSACKSKITKVDDNKYEIITAFVTGKYINTSAYYFGIGDKEQFTINEKIMKKPEEYLLNKYPIKNYKKSIRDIRRLKIDIDSELLNLCEMRVDADISKLGPKVSSNIIDNRNNLNKILGFLVYLSEIILMSHNLNYLYSKKINIENCLLKFPIQWIINKINKCFGIKKEVIENYLEYLTYLGQGTLSDFPLIIEKDNIIAIPSLILLNDWQFSITNGHYVKNIEFIRRDKTISKSVVEKIYNKVKEYRNISVVQEKYYEFSDNNGKKVNSDIDIALYDSINNKILVIECKWKDNHYVNDIDENYFKIEKSLKDIYNKQLSKHKEFLESNIENIGFIFDMNKEILNLNKINISYIAIDKRSEYHIDNEHMISLYAFLALCDIYSEGDILKLDLLINDIESAKMEIKYFMVEEPKTFQIEDIKIINDELKYEYDNY